MIDYSQLMELKGAAQEIAGSAITADGYAGGTIDIGGKILPGKLSPWGILLMALTPSKLADGTLSGGGGQVHRGRIQAQGGGLEASVPWNQGFAPTTAQGQAMLKALQTQLSPKDFRARASAFQKAERFIQNAGNAGGVSAPVSKTFLVKGTRNIRVDIEIITGQALLWSNNSGDINRRFLT